MEGRSQGAHKTNDEEKIEESVCFFGVHVRQFSKVIFQKSEMILIGPRG